MAGSHVCHPIGRPPFNKPSSLLYYQEGPPPSVDIGAWRLRVGERPRGAEPALQWREYGYQELLALPAVSMDRRSVCVCNWSVRHQYTGVLLANVLARNPSDVDEREYLRQESIGTVEKGTYASTVPLKDALERQAILCYAIDGEPLSLERGYPLRFIDFGLYLYKCVKGLASLEVTEAYELGEWERRAGYPVDGTVRRKKYWICDLGERRFIEHEGEVTEF